jgi:hypothetical protein
MAAREGVSDIRNPGGMGFTVIFLQSIGWAVVVVVKFRLDSFLQADPVSTFEQANPNILQGDPAG